MTSTVEMLLRRMSIATNRIYTLPVVVLMPHGGCNCRCAMCDIWKGNAEAKIISRGDVEGWLHDFRRLRVRQVVFSGGEPLLHPDLWGLCEPLRELPARITLLSNGLLLDRHARNVVRWCDEVIVSLDGPREVHDAIRGVNGAFDRLAEGIAAVKGFVPRFRVTARCTIQRRNYADLSKIVDAAREIGLDGVSFLAVDVSTAAFNRSEPWDAGQVSSVALSPAEVSEFGDDLDRFIASHDADFGSGFIAESPEKLRRLVRYFAAINPPDSWNRDFSRSSPVHPVHSVHPAVPGPQPPSCNAPWVSTVIEADGTVRPCFFHPALGNLHERPLGDILNSRESIAFRRTLDVRHDPICQKCVCTLYLGPRADV
jgi:MoaA/NifB/PqqE/SkfB family radical SAM enzyme